MIDNLNPKNNIQYNFLLCYLSAKYKNTLNGYQSYQSGIEMRKRDSKNNAFKKKLKKIEKSVHPTYNLLPLNPINGC
ncbi:MAG: hypothetical protein D4R67_06850 [Bacteroidetes bacterium]|nr:MAG: hypothetical protein D4R67_06850 [Bacteroidota bacterium]